MKTRIVTFLALGGLAGAALPLSAQVPPKNAVAAVEPAPHPAVQPAHAKPAAPPQPAPSKPDTTVAAVEPAPSATTIDAATGADSQNPNKPDPNDFDSIAATVNDQSISDYEVRQRMALFMATAGLHNLSDAEKKRIRGQIIEQLETEKLELQEALKKHITVSPVEVNKQIDRLLSENHLTDDQLRQILANAGTSEDALRAQITAQIAWQKAVNDEYGDRVNITPAQVDAEMRREAEGANKVHFLVSEIFLPVDSPDQDARVLKDAQNIENQIHMGAPFQAIARQFSQNPSAAQGGEIGWVRDGQLPPELNGALEKMQPQEISKPIRSAGGYYILQLQVRQEPLGTKVAKAPTGVTDPNAPIDLVRLLLPLGPSPTKEIVESGMKMAAQLRAAYSGCDQLEKMAAQIKGAVFMKLGAMKPADLSPDIQKALAQSHPGEAAPPVLSDAGVELIGRCDKKVVVQTAFTMPSREQVEEELFDQQISALARRYMRDLRRDADVEVR